MSQDVFEGRLRVRGLLERVEALSTADLVVLAERGGDLDPPSFRGRCLEPAYLAAVACGAWSPDDEAALMVFEEQAGAALCRRVERRHRRGLRNALRAVGLAALTRDLPVASWHPQRERLAQVWPL